VERIEGSIQNPSSCYNLAVEQQGGSIQKCTAPKPLDAVAYELVASNLMQGLGLSVPQDWLSSSIPSRGWLSPSGVSSPSLSLGVGGGSWVRFRYGWWWCVTRQQSVNMDCLPGALHSVLEHHYQW